MATGAPVSLGGAPAPWWSHAFGRAYLTIYGHRDETEARRNTPHLLALLGLRRSSRVLDVGCGEGRYTRALAAEGFRMTGVDYSKELLEEARRASADLPGTPTYLRWDMRDLPFEEQFEGAVSLFTSFGYFDDVGDDARVLRAIHRALVPGGRFVLDFLNAAQVRSHLVAESEEWRKPWTIRSRRRVDETTAGGPFLRKEVVVLDDRTGRVEAHVEERVRLHTPETLEALFAGAGFQVVGPRYGDVDRRPWTPEAPRFVRVAERPSKRPVTFHLDPPRSA